MMTGSQKTEAKMVRGFEMKLVQVKHILTILGNCTRKPNVDQGVDRKCVKNLGIYELNIV